MSDLTIYEVSRCSACQKLTALLDERGVEYDGVEYHETGLDEATIRDLLAKSGLGARDILRAREPLVEQLGLGEGEGAGEDELIAAMAEHPRLMQRPIAVRGDRALLARPPERVLELLE